MVRHSASVTVRTPSSAAFFGLAASIGPEHDKVGALAHAIGHLGAERFGAGLGFRPAHRLEAAREHHDLARQCTARRGAGCLLNVELGGEPVEDAEVALLRKKAGKLGGERLADADDAAKGGPRLAANRGRSDHLLAPIGEGAVMPRQQPRIGLPHPANAEPEDEPRQLDAAPGFDGAE